MSYMLNNDLEYKSDLFKSLYFEGEVGMKSYYCLMSTEFQPRMMTRFWKQVAMLVVQQCECK